MTRLENEKFLEQLKTLFQNNRVKGTVVLTMKRYDGRTKPIPQKDTSLPLPKEHMCLIRAYCSGAKKRKISTVIHQKEVNKFQIAYCSLLKTNMDGLKKKKKVKKTKA
ncbi:hypothetical protein PGB90_004268 [Kerria lacca]